MTVKEFELKTGIRITSGIMPIKAFKKNEVNPYGYAFKYIFYNDSLILLFGKSGNEYITSTGENVDVCAEKYQHDNNRNFIEFNDPEFEKFLDWYWNKYGLLFFNDEIFFNL